MRTTTKILSSAVAIVGIAGIALGTPIVGLISPLLAVGNQNHDIHERGTFQNSTGEEFHALLKTEGPSTISIQDAAFAVGGQNGWHSHPGVVIVTIISGTLEWFDENCHRTIYTAGDSWVEGSQLHAFRNIGQVSLHAMAVFVTAQGQALRTDQPAPPCASGLGL